MDADVTTRISDEFQRDMVPVCNWVADVRLVTLISNTIEFSSMTHLMRFI
jgi:hypothetical protein